VSDLQDKKESCQIDQESQEPGKNDDKNVD
jgi:hypothetical protein